VALFREALNRGWRVDLSRESLATVCQIVYQLNPRNSGILPYG